MSFEKNTTQRKFCEIAAFIQKKNRFPEGLLKRYYKKTCTDFRQKPQYLPYTPYMAGRNFFLVGLKKFPPKNFPTCCTLCILTYSHWDRIPKNAFSHFQILKNTRIFLAKSYIFKKVF